MQNPGVQAEPRGFRPVLKPMTIETENGLELAEVTGD